MSMAMTFPSMTATATQRRGICELCKRPLTDPKSVAAGMGPICRGHAGTNQSGDRMTDTAQRTEFIDVFYGLIPFSQAFVMHRNGNPGDADNERSVVVTNVPHLVVHHSPSGFEFGYGGSGAADLALNACQLYLNQVNYSGLKTKCYDGTCWKLAWYLHQEFKREFIADVNWRRGATIPFEKIETWFNANMTSELMRGCEARKENDEC
jgi:hypothetical protein